MSDFIRHCVSPPPSYYLGCLRLKCTVCVCLWVFVCACACACVLLFVIVTQWHEHAVSVSLCAPGALRVCGEVVWSSADKRCATDIRPLRRNPSRGTRVMKDMTAGNCYRGINTQLDGKKAEMLQNRGENEDDAVRADLLRGFTPSLRSVWGETPWGWGAEGELEKRGQMLKVCPRRVEEPARKAPSRNSCRKWAWIERRMHVVWEISVILQTYIICTSSGKETDPLRFLHM